MGTPAREITITDAQVGDLLRANGLDPAGRHLALLDEGWDNVSYTLEPGAGDDPLAQRLIVRLPRRSLAVPLLMNEQRWLARLPPLPIAIPRVLRSGTPAAGYPWPFSILPWIPGEAADLRPPDAAEATRYADFYAALHVTAAPDAPANPVRGVPLGARAAAFEERWSRCAPA
ncbi:MAG: phosphotransferase, partial [Pseudomonadota bacterium]